MPAYDGPERRARLKIDAGILMVFRAWRYEEPAARDQ
jgi:hypothetical protein